MSLAPGARLGPYEVIAPLGAGGMGAVYRARDTRLNRTVAIKAMHATVAGDPERVARFAREAQLLASLNHPNIAAIHGLQESAAGSGHAEGATYLVLEFVEGRTLADTIREQGAVSIADAMPLARQIADAIAAAHDKGIIHRDLKPGNIMITHEGQAKVLDFGLGKALEGDGSRLREQDPSPYGAANSPTITLAATQQGIILGTAGYMSPEQAKGRVADKRSDVWAFGCVLFEMLTGKRAFDGEDITDTLAAIVRGEPDWTLLPSATPPAVRTMMQRCLIKDRAQRLPDMSVVRYILNEPATISAPIPGSKDPGLHSSDAERQAGPGKRAMTLPVVAALVIAAVLATLGIQRFWSASTAIAPAAGVSRFTIVLPAGDEVGTVNLGPLTISPDGTVIAYVGLRAGKLHLFVRQFAEPDPKLLEGTDGARAPFFSHDGRWIGFFADRKLKKITVAGTGRQDLADAVDTRGGTWSVDNTIYFAPSNTSGLMKVSASGGQAVEVTKPDRNAGEITHRWPHVLADGKALLFSVWTGPGFDEHRVERLSLADGQRSVLVRGADGMLAATGGYFLYGGRLDGILAAPWQPAQMTLQSVEPIVLPMEARIDNEGAVAYAVSNNGTFAYLKGAVARRLARIVWIDRTGKSEEVPVPHRDFVGAAISPDGRQAVLQLRGGTEDLWVMDFTTGSFTPLVATGGSSQGAVWTVDGKFLIYRCTRGGYRNLCRRPADGTGAEERLTTKVDVIQTPTSVSPDGKWLLFFEGGQGPAGGADIWKLPLDGSDRTPVQVVATEAAEINGQVSPDGRWLAYESLVSGRYEIWVQPFAKEGRRQQVSRDGGTAPRWSRDGSELFFSSGSGDAMISVAVSGDTFLTPRQLFPGRYRPAANGNTNYDVAKDGRFLHVQQIMPSTAVTQIEIVINGLPRAGAGAGR